MGSKKRKIREIRERQEVDKFMRQFLEGIDPELQKEKGNESKNKLERVEKLKKKAKELGVTSINSIGAGNLVGIDIEELEYCFDRIEETRKGG